MTRSEQMANLVWGAYVRALEIQENVEIEYSIVKVGEDSEETS